MSAATVLPAEVLAASNETLVDALKALTHRIHEATATVRANPATWAEQTEADLRVQRDAVEAEVLRRMALGWEARA